MFNVRHFRIHGPSRGSCIAAGTDRGRRAMDRNPLQTDGCGIAEGRQGLLTTAGPQRMAQDREGGVLRGVGCCCVQQICSEAGVLKPLQCAVHVPQKFYKSPQFNRVRNDQGIPLPTI